MATTKTPEDLSLNFQAVKSVPTRTRPGRARHPITEQFIEYLKLSMQNNEAYTVVVSADDEPGVRTKLRAAAKFLDIEQTSSYDSDTGKLVFAESKVWASIKKPETETAEQTETAPATDTKGRKAS